MARGLAALFTKWLQKLRVSYLQRKRELLASADISACTSDSNWVTRSLGDSEPIRGVPRYPQSSELRMEEGHPEDDHRASRQKQRRRAAGWLAEGRHSVLATPQQGQAGRRFGASRFAVPRGGPSGMWTDRASYRGQRERRENRERAADSASKSHQGGLSSEVSREKKEEENLSSGHPQ